MNCWKEYINYLKDNPEGYWFKRKLYGYGWTPAKLEGWIIIGVYIIFLLGIVWYAQASGAYEHGETPTRIIYLVAGATVLLLAITWRTGEPLKWQWGKKQSER